MMHSYLMDWRCKAKSLDHDKKVTVTYKYEVTCSVELNKYPKYDDYLFDKSHGNKAKSLDHEL